MTAADVIAPVVLPPPATSGRTTTRGESPSLARAPLPLADLPPQRTSAVVYGASAVDDRGRVTDRAVLRALGWTAGCRLDIDLELLNKLPAFVLVCRIPRLT